MSTVYRYSKYVLLFIVSCVFLVGVHDLWLWVHHEKVSTSNTQVTLSEVTSNGQYAPMSYYTNIVTQTQTNMNFRHVLFTGKQSQLVIMSIPPGGEVGEEVHEYTEQTLFFLSGTGEGILDDKKFAIGPGDVVVVVPGTKHNFINTGKDILKIYTVYAPPNHIDGRIQATKADADNDLDDEAIGNTKPIVK